LSESKTPPMSATGPGWPARLMLAARFAASRRAAWTAAAGFLVRGGLVVLLLPIVVLPSVIDIAGLVGVNAFGVAGQPTSLFIALVIVVVLAATGWLILAAIFGSLIDVWLVRMALEAAGGEAAGGEAAGGEAAGASGEGSGAVLELPDSSVVMELAAIRIMCLVPLAIALAWATTQVFSATYDELITPSNIATPLPVRVVFAATAAVAVLVVVWMFTEAVAAVAVRRHLLFGSDFLDSILAALGQTVRRPLQTLGTQIVTVTLSVVAVGLALLASAVAFDWCRVIARSSLVVDLLGSGRDFRPVVFALASLVLALAWIVAVVVAATTSAWRSAAFTYEVKTVLDERGSKPGRA
jgi:hypothetical protein